MRTAMRAMIRKDFRGIAGNHRLFSTLFIVPLVLTVLVPSVFLLVIHFMPEEAELSKFLDMLPISARLETPEATLSHMILNYVLPVFFLLIPIFSASIMAASAFVGEKERHTLETLLYCPLTLRQIFQAKVLASFLLSMLVSLISFLAMILTVEAESLLLTRRLLLPSVSWLPVMLLLAPSLSLTAITLIVRGSARARSVEESQQAAVFLILPLLLLIVGQLTGILLLNVWILLGIGVVCAALGLFLLGRCAGRFTFERLLQY